EHVRPADDRLGLRRRLRPRLDDPGGRARIGDPRKRDVRQLRLVLAGHPRRRRRHERPERQLLPLPRPDLRQRRQRERQLADHGSPTRPTTRDAPAAPPAPTAPPPAPTATSGAANQYYAAGTLWFRPAGSGSFTLNATASDAQSGIEQVGFPNVSGTSGWAG